VPPKTDEWLEWEVDYVSSLFFLLLLRETYTPSLAHSAPLRVEDFLISFVVARGRGRGWFPWCVWSTYPLGNGPDQRRDPINQSIIRLSDHMLAPNVIRCNRFSGHLHMRPLVSSFRPTPPLLPVFLRPLSPMLNDIKGPRDQLIRPGVRGNRNRHSPWAVPLFPLAHNPLQHSRNS